VSIYDDVRRAKILAEQPYRAEPTLVSPGTADQSAWIASVLDDIDKRRADAARKETAMLRTLLAGDEFMLFGCRARASIEWIDEPPVGLVATALKSGHSGVFGESA
jgi:hypothetical protein